MSVLWMHIPPRTRGGWAFELEVGLVILWIIGLTIAVLVGWLLDKLNQPSYRSRVLEQQRQAARAIALREQQEAARARQAIDNIYRQAEQEVRRLGHLALLPPHSGALRSLVLPTSGREPVDFSEPFT